MLSNYSTIGIVEETVPGTTPAAALQRVNCSSFPMRQERNVGRPNVLTGDRRRYPNRILQKSGTLSAPMPQQFANDRMLFEGLLQNDVSAEVLVTGTTFTFSATQILDSGNGLAVFAVGDLVLVSGSSIPGNNRVVGPVTAVAAGALTVPSGQLTVDATPGENVTVRTTRLVDGTTYKSYSAEWKLEKLTNEFRSVVMATPESVQMQWEQNQFATATWALQSKVPAMGNATIGTGGPLAAPTTGMMNSVDDFQRFVFGGGSVSNSMIVTSWQLEVRNMLQAIYGLGTVGPSQFDVGSFDVALNLNVYYNDDARALQDAIEAHTTLWTWWSQVDPQGNIRAFLVPACKPDTGDPEIGEADTPVNLPAVLSGHDPAKDSSAAYPTIPFQFGVFYFAAP